MCVEFINAAMYSCENIANRILDTVQNPDIYIPADTAYDQTYDALKYAGEQCRLNPREENIKVLALAVYGWMPTALDSMNYKHGDVSRAITPLIDNPDPTIERIESYNTLAQMLNNSYVGLSKFLHAMFPDYYAIFDSRIAFVLNHICRDMTITGQHNRSVRIFTNEANNVAKFLIYESAMRNAVLRQIANFTTLRAIEKRLFYYYDIIHHE